MVLPTANKPAVKRSLISAKRLLKTTKARDTRGPRPPKSSYEELISCARHLMLDAVVVVFKYNADILITSMKMSRLRANFERIGKEAPKSLRTNSEDGVQWDQFFYDFGMDGTLHFCPWHGIVANTAGVEWLYSNAPGSQEPIIKMFSDRRLQLLPKGRVADMLAKMVPPGPVYFMKDLCANITRDVPVVERGMLVRACHELHAQVSVLADLQDYISKDPVDMTVHNKTLSVYFSDQLDTKVRVAASYGSIFGLFDSVRKSIEENTRLPQAEQRFVVFSAAESIVTENGLAGKKEFSTNVRGLRAESNIAPKLNQSGRWAKASSIISRRLSFATIIRYLGNRPFIAELVNEIGRALTTGYEKAVSAGDKVTPIDQNTFNNLANSFFFDGITLVTDPEKMTKLPASQIDVGPSGNGSASLMTETVLTLCYFFAKRYDLKSAMQVFEANELKDLNTKNLFAMLDGEYRTKAASSRASAGPVNLEFSDQSALRAAEAAAKLAANRQITNLLRSSSPVRTGSPAAPIRSPSAQKRLESAGTAPVADWMRGGPAQTQTTTQGLWTPPAAPTWSPSATVVPGAAGAVVESERAISPTGRGGSNPSPSGWRPQTSAASAGSTF